MSLRFRKTFTIFPGVRLNIAKKSISVSLGRDGATVNLGKQGVRGTVGLPGSGLSYSKVLVPRRSIDKALGGATARHAATPPRRQPEDSRAGEAPLADAHADGAPPPLPHHGAPTRPPGDSSLPRPGHGADEAPTLPPGSASAPRRSGKRFGGAHSPPPPPEPVPASPPEPAAARPPAPPSPSGPGAAVPPPLPGTTTAPPPIPPAAEAPSGLVPIVSAPVEELTSPSLEGLLTLMRKAEEQRRTVSADLAEARSELAERERAGGDAAEARAEIARLQDWLSASRIDADFDVPDSAHPLWDALETAFDRLRRSAQIWDVTAARPHDAEGGPERQVERRPVTVDFATFPLLTFAGQALRFSNANGEEILIYPALAVIPARDGGLALIDLRDLRVAGEVTPLTEPGPVPADARASARRTPGPGAGLPVLDYGRLTIRSTTGLDEEYLVSDADAAPLFAAAFDAFQAALGTEASGG